jgi:predicted nucleotidyltransferase
MDKKTALEKIRDYIHLLKNKGYDVQKAFLYGSYSRGEGKIESDIDVMLVMGADDELDDKAKGVIWALTLQVDSRIEPYIVTQQRFAEDDGTPLLRIVKTEGIEIAC